MNYMAGVYTNRKCPKTPDHAVIVVGYGKDEKFGDYWLVKNSWVDKIFLRIPTKYNQGCKFLQKLTHLKVSHKYSKRMEIDLRSED
jgi:Papain family cysteine protease